MLSGRIPTCRDETGALFIDRDPKLFSIILQFLRTKELDLNGVDVSVLRHEAEFYGIVPLVKRLVLCEDLERSLCGDVLFTGFIPKPKFIESNSYKSSKQQSNTGDNRAGNRLPSTASATTSNTPNSAITAHSRNSSVTDFMNSKKSHSRTSSYEWTYHYQAAAASAGHYSANSRNQSIEIKQLKSDLGKFNN
jgi:hypothetical protein